MTKKAIDIDRTSIIDDAYTLLQERHWYDVTKHGIEVNLLASIQAKENKILEMMKSPFYNGNLQLVMPVTISRVTENYEIKKLIRELYYKISETENLFIDKDGKIVDDYLLPVAKIVDPTEIKSFDYSAVIQTIKSNWSKDLKNLETMTKVDKILKSLEEIRYSDDFNRMSSVTAERLNNILCLDKKKIISGQKVSKIINRLLNMCQDNGVTYNKLFTTLSDLLNPHDISMYYVVSLNFLDYLRMSDGHSWASCHTTDKDNTRHNDNHYSGAYCQGTLAYANDGVSYVTYLIMADGADVNHPERSDKMYREMYHVDDSKNQIIQGRVYPQGNDGKTDIYKLMFDNFMSIMGLNKDDYNCQGAAPEYSRTCSCGAQYPDYINFNDCKYYLKKGAERNKIFIGAPAYSCSTGNELNIDRHNTIV